MRKKYKLKKEFKKLLILFLGMALATQLVGNSVVFAMNDSNDVIATYEVGVEGNNVIATLTKDGTMTLSGAGDTKDYTSDTMPFQDNISNIKDIVIEEGVTSIGDAMFYNCKDVTGKLVIPSTVVEIGDYAFAGDSYESAPKITKIENSFTQSNIVVETPVEKKIEDSATEKSTEEHETSAVEEPATDTAFQDDTTKQEEQPVQETVKTVKSITEQQIGMNIFVQGQNGGYSCTETNRSFISAAEEAGYVRADRFVLVKMDDSITQEVPVVGGQLVLPSKPDTLGVPAEDALTSYQFAGWTVEGSDKVLNPKDNYSISDNAEELNLTSQWQQTWKINPKVETEAKEEVSIYTIIDSNTGKVLEKVNGYTVNVQWQINKKDKEDENSWENIESATSFTYERKAESGDTTYFFRAKLSITKQSKLRNLPETEVMTTDAVNGVNTTNFITVTYDSNGGTGTIDTKEIKDGENYKPEENTFTRTDGKVFIGWKVALTGVNAIKNNGTSVNADDVIQPYDALTISLSNGSESGKVTLTAQWSTTNVIYVDGVNGANSNNGLTKDSAVKTIEQAYTMLPENGTLNTNKIIIVGTYTFSGTYSLPNKATTIEGFNENTVVTLNETIRLLLNNETKFENITIECKVVEPIHSGYGIVAQGNLLIMGKDLNVIGDNFSLIGGKFGNLTGNTNLIIYSGTYKAISSGNWEGELSGDTNTTIYGGEITDIVYAGGSAKISPTGMSGAPMLKGSSHLWFYDGTATKIVAGGRFGQISGEGHDYGSKVSIYSGKFEEISAGNHAGGYGAKTLKKSLLHVENAIIGRLELGGMDAAIRVNEPTLLDGVDANIKNTTINGDFLCGGYDAWQPKGFASVKGNINVNIIDSMIKGNFYGAGYQGGVDSDIVVNVTNTIMNNVYGGGLGNSSYSANNLRSFTLTIDKDTTANNIYGGGNTKSTVSGLVTINCNGTVDNLYGGGYGSATSVNGGSIINVGQTAVINQNLYGGGDAGIVSGNAIINIDGGLIKGNIYGAGNNVGVNNSNITIKNNPNITGNVYGGSNASGWTTESIININGAVNTNIFGGGNGAGTTVTTSTVNIESTANITGNVFGGGELGVVETSNVNLNGGTIAGKVFGGGNNVGVTTSNVNVNGTTNLTENDSAIFGGSNAQGTTNTSNVNVNSRISKNVYGGGLGSDTTVNNSYVNTKSITNEIYGGGKEGKVKKVVINLEDGAEGSNVFGGGHLVGIDESVEINAKYGSNFTNIYGGSNEKGTVKNPVINYEGKATSVYGAGKGDNTITLNPSIIVGQCEMTQSVYGGGEKGVTKGIANVTITKPVSVMNLFGAGNEAGVDGDTNITITADGAAGYVFGGSYSSGEVTGTAKINISGNAFFDVYGGGYGANTKVKNTNVVTTSSAKVDSNVYGGSKDGIITGNTEIEINGKVSKSVYGAGEGVTSDVMGNTHLVLFGATVSGDVFGGGNKGGIAGDSHVDLLSGTVGGSAFGGSNQAKVQGNSKVHMGINAATDQPKPTVMNMIIKGSVYGGGNTTDSGKAFDASNPFVLGDSEVLIDQAGYNFDNFSIGKNILGDGNMCVTAGNKTISISGYRPSKGLKTLESIQRATTLIIDSSIIELTGSMDSANLLPTKLYSMSRIDTIKMKGEVDLFFQKEVNLVRNLESYVPGGSLADHIDAMEAGGNRLTLQQGTGFELRTNEDVSRPGYGNVKGYAQLNRYDKDGYNLVDGIYVLGGYDETNALYGFVFGDDVYEIKDSGKVQVNKRGDVITPESDSKSWNNWRLGRRVDVREITLVASDRPSYGKTIGVESTWAADGSIYRIDKDSLKIENQNNSSEVFTLVSPDSLSTQNGINNTFGLEISTGQNGWLEQKNVGHMEGSSTGTANSIMLQDDSDMIAVNDSKVKPLINVTLSNLTGITSKDDKSPLLVTFDINTYTKQADGTEMKTGTMTIKVNIIRDIAETYSDTTIEAGKNYKGAIQTYEYGIDHKSGLTISQSSSITTQFARKESSGAAAPTRHELNFKTALPTGTKILMIDRSTNDMKYYHYEATASVSKIALSDFIANDSTNGKYTPITNGSSAENYIFIIDFEGAPSFAQKDIDMSLTAYNGNTSISEKHIVFSVFGNQRIYTLSSLKDDEKTYTPYSIGSTISVDLATSVNVTGLDGIDTTGRDKQMGARVSLYSVDNDSYINIPSTWEVISQGTHYAAGGNNFTINLADGLTVTNSNIYIQMSSIGNLPIGKYRLDIDLISGALANYPEDDSALAKNTIKIGIDLKDYSYSIKSTMADKNRQLFSNTDTNKNVEIKLEKATSAGASTTGVYVRQTLYKKNEYTGIYESVDLTELFDSSTLPLVKNKLAWDKNVLNYKYKNDIKTGTYRLQFDVMQADAFNDLAKAEDIVRATDTINIVVTDD